MTLKQSEIIFDRYLCFIFNSLNPTGQYTGSRKCVPNTLQAGIPAFAMVCQKPEEALNRRR